jgi:hypothetical protein
MSAEWVNYYVASYLPFVISLALFVWIMKVFGAKYRENVTRAEQTLELQRRSVALLEEIVGALRKTS